VVLLLAFKGKKDNEGLEVGEETTLEIEGSTSDTLAVPPRSQRPKRDSLKRRESYLQHHPSPEATAASSRISIAEFMKIARIGQHLPNRTTIVLSANGWIELRCPVCHTNALPGGRPFKGAFAFSRHMRQAHNITTTTAQALNECYYRAVPEEEVRGILREDLGDSEAADEELVNAVAATNAEELFAKVAGLPTVQDEVLISPHTLGWDFVKDPAHFLPQHGCVALALDTKWYELWCPFCHTNAEPQTKDYIQGAKGVYDHIKHVHPVEKQQEGLSGASGPMGKQSER
jgi:hypothetical protein